ncbi:MAG: FGGY-family carbohydrate kinase [Candidatus Binatia bacterium]
MPAHFLALDAGTGSGRAVLFDEAGNQLACAREEWSYESTHHPGDMVAGHHFDADRFWGLLARASRAALAAAGVEPGSIAGVAATSQREGSVFLDGRGRELLATPNFDSRAIAEGVDVLQRLGADRLYEITGHEPPFIFPLSRLLWWRSRHPETPVASLLMIDHWVTYRLTGERVAEPSNAAESLLFDVAAGGWSDEIREAFDVSDAILPRLAMGGSPAGFVSAEAAAATGLREGTPVFVGGADTQCALLGSGVVEAGAVGAVLGTTAPVQMVLDRPLSDGDRHLWLSPHVCAGRWVIESNAGDGGKAFAWLLELLDVPSSDDASFAAIETEAERADPDVPVYAFIGPSIFNLRSMNPSRAAGLLFPYPFGRRRPAKPELLRGFLESLAFAVRGNLEQIESVTGRRAASVTLSGGMTKSRLARRLVAQLLGRPVAAGAVAESAALGCAVLAAAGAGVYPDVGSAAARMVRTEEIEAEDPGATEDRYRKWRELNDTLERITIP